MRPPDPAARLPTPAADAGGEGWAWPFEDGGPRRWGCAPGGLGLGADEELMVVAHRDAYATDMLARRGPGELYALRRQLPRGEVFAGSASGHVERLDPGSLAVVARSPQLPGGRYWPGGVNPHPGGDLIAVLGSWAHRLDAEDCTLLASHRLPGDLPHNSFVIHPSGAVVTKSCDAPEGREPSVLSVLDPVTLLPVTAPLRLAEPCIARLALDADGRIVVVGSTTVWRLAYEPATGRITIDERWQPRFATEPTHSFGWDPVVTDTHVLWMDNGRAAADTSFLGAGRSPGAVRLWRARLDDAASACGVEMSGLPYGTQSNPPAWDPVAGQVVAFDAAHGVLRAWRLEDDELVATWTRRGFAHAAHLVVYPETRELLATDWHEPALRRRPPVRRVLTPVLRRAAGVAAARRAAGRFARDDLVVLDLDTGRDRGRVRVASPVQGYLFPAPGFGRDVYYQSLSTIARVEVVGRRS